MAKPDITAVAAAFEQMVSQMHVQMVHDRATMLGGVNLANLGVSHTGDNQRVAASPVGGKDKSIEGGIA